MLLRLNFEIFKFKDFFLIEHEKVFWPFELANVY